MQRIVNGSNQIIVFSGKAGVGKTTAAEGLCASTNAVHLRTSRLILQLRPNTLQTRVGLQEAGNALDAATNYNWIADGSVEIARINPLHPLVIDAARVPEQIQALRATFQYVAHVHLVAQRGEIKRRFARRAQAVDDGITYEEVEADISEGWDAKLAIISDFTLDVTTLEPESIRREILTFTKL